MVDALDATWMLEALGDATNGARRTALLSLTTRSNFATNGKGMATRSKDATRNKGCTSEALVLVHLLTLGGRYV